MSNWVPKLEGNPGHLYRALAEAIRDAVQANELKHGEKLLPHREMAWKLGVTAATVARAYHIAEEWGLVFARVGHGTRVREPGDNREPITLREGNDRTVDGAFATTVNFGLLLPTPLNDGSLRRQAFEMLFARIGRDLLDRQLSGYAPDLGYRAHREAGATWLSYLGERSSSEDILLTRGAQEAFLLLLSAFTQPGDPVLVEETIYLGLLHLLRLRNHQMIPLPSDPEGILPDTIERRAKQSGAKLLLLNPTLHNPTGKTLSLERRKAIADAVERAELIVVENDPFAALINKPRPVSIASLAPNRTFYLASLSKCTGPAMRVCFLQCPPGHTQSLEGVKHALTLGGSFLQAEIAAEWIRKGLLEELCAWQRGEIKRRWSLANTVLKDYMAKNLRPAPFVYIHLPDPWRAGEFVSAAQRRSVTCLEADRFIVGRGGAPHAVRLALSSPASEVEVRRGLQNIGELLSSYTSTTAMSY